MSLRNDNLVKKPELSCKRRAPGWRVEGKAAMEERLSTIPIFPSCQGTSKVAGGGCVLCLCLLRVWA